MNYRLLSVAQAELAEAARWYEDQADGLGQEFLRRIWAGDGLGHTFPGGMEAYRRTASSLPVRRFPK